MSSPTKDTDFSVTLGKSVQLTISEHSVLRPALTKPSPSPSPAPPPPVKRGRGRPRKQVTPAESEEPKPQEGSTPSSGSTTDSSTNHVITALSSKDCLNIWQQARKANKQQQLLNLFKKCNNQLLQRLKNDSMTERDETYMVNLLCQTGVVRMKRQDGNSAAEQKSKKVKSSTTLKLSNTSSFEFVAKEEPDTKQSDGGATQGGTSSKGTPDVVDESGEEASDVTGLTEDENTDAFQGIEIKGEYGVSNVHIAHIIQEDIEIKDENKADIDLSVLKVKEEKED
ncbi:uncharacterized protein LOC144444709 [Glandiceps talaboti]